METLFGACLLSIVVMGVLSLLPAASSTGRRAAQELAARALAQSLLEEQRAVPVRSMSVGATPLPPVTVEGVEYVPTLDVAPVAGEDPARLKQIGVTVRWSYRDRQYRVAEETYIVQIPR